MSEKPAGLFITLEGGEGAGKSTQARRLKAFLEEQGREVILTREPGGTPEAEKIRDLLVQRDGGEWTPLAECLLFFTARHMHAQKLIRPALAEGKIVICDRFTDSTRAYQGYGHGFDPETIEQVKTLALGDFEPDLTLIFDVPVDVGLARSFDQKMKSAGRESTEDRFEKLDRAFHERLRQGFLDIASKNPQRCVVIDAAQTPEEIFARLVSVIQERLAA
jgi:dTMP kinase